MEIAILPKNAVKVKGKHALFIINPSDKATGYQAGLYLQNAPDTLADGVAISGPGEYEIGGVKISGIKSAQGFAYSLNVDEIDILVGSLSVVEKLQHKLKEHNLVLILTEEEGDASFLTGIATNGILAYGEKASNVIGKFAKEGLNQMNKYTVTKDKLPTEIQTILLA